MDEAEYWPYLEFRICRELAGMRERSLRGWWCDGFIPESFDANRRCVTGRVWMAHGKDQQAWDFTLVFRSPWRAPEEVDWGALVLAEDVTGWLSIDVIRKAMKIEPHAGYSDRAPAPKS